MDLHGYRGDMWGSGWGQFPNDRDRGRGIIWGAQNGGSFLRIFLALLTSLSDEGFERSMFDVNKKINKLTNCFYDYKIELN
jgi:hypothetical protein